MELIADGCEGAAGVGVGATGVGVALGVGVGLGSASGSAWRRASGSGWASGSGVGVGLGLGVGVGFGGVGQFVSALNLPFIPSWCGHENSPVMWCVPGVDVIAALCHVPLEPEKVKPVIVATVLPSTAIVPEIGLL